MGYYTSDLLGIVDKLQEMSIQYSENIEELDGKNVILRGRVAELEKKNKELSDKVEYLGNRNKKLKNDFIEYRINACSTKEFKDLQEENKRLKEELQFVRDDNTKFEEDVEQLNSEKRKLEAELEDADQRLLEANVSIDILADEKSGWIRKEDRLLKENSDLHRRLVEAGDLIKFLFASNAELRIKNDGIYHDIACELLQIFTDYVDNGPDNLCTICPEEAENRADLLEKMMEIRKKYNM